MLLENLYKKCSLKNIKSFKIIHNYHEVSKSDEDKIRKYVLNHNPKSAWAKHVIGRHVADKTNSLTQEIKTAIDEIFKLQNQSELHSRLKNLPSAKPQMCCCENFYNELIVNCIHICQITRMDFNAW